MADIHTSIRRAICETDGFDFDTIEPGEYADHADAVLALPVRLDDGSTRTVQAIHDAGEACLQHTCRAAHDLKTLEQERYNTREQISAALDDLDDLTADGEITAVAAAKLRSILRDAIGLTTTA